MLLVVDECVRREVEEVKVGGEVREFFEWTFVWGDVDPHGGGLSAGEPDGCTVVVEVSAASLFEGLRGGVEEAHACEVVVCLAVRQYVKQTEEVAADSPGGPVLTLPQGLQTAPWHVLLLQPCSHRARMRPGHRHEDRHRPTQTPTQKTPSPRPRPPPLPHPFTRPHPRLATP